MPLRQDATTTWYAVEDFWQEPRPQEAAGTSDVRQLRVVARRQRIGLVTTPAGVAGVTGCRFGIVG